MDIICKADGINGNTYTFGATPKAWKLPPGFVLKMDRYPGTNLAEVVPAAVDVTPWTGEGLPPVGTVCVCTYLGVNHQVRILGIDGKDVWCHGPHGKYTLMNSQPGSFIPIPVIRTPEQIAEEEREAAAKELFHVVYPNGQWAAMDSVAMEGFFRIYDAGYRKQVKP